MLRVRLLEMSAGTGIQLASSPWPPTVIDSEAPLTVILVVTPWDVLSAETGLRRLAIPAVSTVKALAATIVPRSLGSER